MLTKFIYSLILQSLKCMKHQLSYVIQEKWVFGVTNNTYIVIKVYFLRYSQPSSITSLYKPEGKISPNKFHCVNETKIFLQNHLFSIKTSRSCVILRRNYGLHLSPANSTLGSTIFILNLISSHFFRISMRDEISINLCEVQPLFSF